MSVRLNAVLDNGDIVPLSQEEGQKILYAMTSIAATPLGARINVLRLEDEQGMVHWPPSAIKHSQG